MGKGIPAALLGAATKSALLRALGDLTRLSGEGTLPMPREIVMLAHASIARQLIDLESFVTLCYARIDGARRRLDFVDCGHTGIVLRRGATGDSEVLHGVNLPLGVRQGELYEQSSAAIEPGDSLLLFSDGVTEARSHGGELFGVDRLAACVRDHRGGEPQALVDAVRSAVLAFTGSDRLADDLTSVAIHIDAASQPLAHGELVIASDPKQLQRVRDFVRDFCCAAPGRPIDDAGICELELAVNEAASNVMKHAYQGRLDQWIHVETEAFPGRVSIRLHHLGLPFVASSAPDPAFDGSRESGFGVYMIARSVDEVRYYQDARGRNCVALTKGQRSAPEEEARWR
jgi:phosphoserine phosphatase RsbU/P